MGTRWASSWARRPLLLLQALRKSLREEEAQGEAGTAGAAADIEQGKGAPAADVGAEGTPPAASAEAAASAGGGPADSGKLGASASGGGGGGEGGEDGEEVEERVVPTLLRLRLSYRVEPAALAPALPAAGVPECGDVPVETATTPLPRQAHCYAHGGEPPGGRGAALSVPCCARGVLLRALAYRHLLHGPMVHPPKLAGRLQPVWVVCQSLRALCARLLAGFMGLAVSMLGEAQWRDILQAEDPGSFKKAHK